VTVCWLSPSCTYKAQLVNYLANAATAASYRVSNADEAADLAKRLRFDATLARFTCPT